MGRLIAWLAQSFFSAAAFAQGFSRKARHRRPRLFWNGDCPRL